MGMLPTLRAPKLHSPIPKRGTWRDSLGLHNHVYYDQYNPNSEKGTDVRKSLSGLDYSPLRRVTFESLSMAILISMGGFMLVTGHQAYGSLADISEALATILDKSLASCPFRTSCVDLASTIRPLDCTTSPMSAPASLWLW